MISKFSLYYFIIIFSFYSVSELFSQELLGTANHEISLTLNGKTIIFGRTHKKMRALPELTYFWYYKHDIHNSQGNWEGELIHGSYRIFDRYYNLIEKGCFRNGLKHGKWQKWNSSGRLIKTENWYKGWLMGPFTQILADSTLVMKGNYRYSKLDGKQIILHNDSIISIKKYRKGVEIFSTGKRVFHFPKFNLKTVPKNANDTI